MFFILAAANNKLTVIPRCVSHQEVEAGRKEKAAAEKELSSRMTHWQEERHQLIHSKDTERQKAIQEVRDECEKDYKQFVADHSDTLSSALRAARHEFSREKVSLLSHFHAALCLCMGHSCVVVSSLDCH